MFSRLLNIKKFEIRDVIGSGTYGEVFKAVYGDKTIACKMSSKDEDDIHHPGTLREIASLSFIRHPNIIEIFDIDINHHYTTTLYMPYYEYTLKSLLHKRKKTGEPFWIFNSLLQAVNFLHSIGVAHRDIKPENILINFAKKELRLCDFGLCRKAVKGPATLKVVSAPYKAPELLQGETLYNMYMIDVWSLGCVFYEVLSRRLLFTPYKGDKRQLQDIHEILKNPSWMGDVDTPDNMIYCSVIRQCIKLDPEDRSTSASLLYQLLADKKKIDEIGIPTYNVHDLNIEKKFVHFNERRWKLLITRFHHFCNEFSIQETTINMAEKYMICFLNSNSLATKYEDLLYKASLYIAIRINETIFPRIEKIYEKEYSMKEINNMESMIIRCCKGNLWMLEISSND